MGSKYPFHIKNQEKAWEKVNKNGGGNKKLVFGGHNRNNSIA